MNHVKFTLLCAASVVLAVAAVWLPVRLFTLEVQIWAGWVDGYVPKGWALAGSVWYWIGTGCMSVTCIWTGIIRWADRKPQLTWLWLGATLLWLPVLMVPAAVVTLAMASVTTWCAAVAEAAK